MTVDGTEVVRFGGVAGTNASSDVWSWDGAVWTALGMPGGTYPPARSDEGLAAVGGTIVVYGGRNDIGSSLVDTWTSPDGNTWNDVTPPATASPQPGFPAMTALGSGAVMFNGCETWTLSLTDVPSDAGTDAGGGNAGAGGRAGASGGAGAAGNAGAGGIAGGGGNGGKGSGGAAGRGVGGAGGNAGASGTGGASGTAGTGGSPGSGGASGAAGTTGQAGASGTGGASGAAGKAGATGTAGVSGKGGAGGSPGTGGSGGGDTGSSGCSCEIGGGPAPAGLAGTLLALTFVVGRRRARKTTTGPSVARPKRARL
jgi:MYXO-CTERM domain-containing protein